MLLGLCADLSVNQNLFKQSFERQYDLNILFIATKLGYNDIGYDAFRMLIGNIDGVKRVTEVV